MLAERIDSLVAITRLLQQQGEWEPLELQALAESFAGL